jgi:SSS family solute:Na+ symporter
MIICAVLISSAGILKSGGIGQVIAAMPEGTQWFSFSGQSGIIMLGWFLSMGVQPYAGQTEWNAIASAKNPETARKGLLFNGIAQVIFGLIVITIGMLAVINFPNLETSNNVFTMISNWVNPFCGALAISAIFAAAASTAKGMFIAQASVLLSWVQQYSKYKGITINDKQGFYIAKISSIIFAMIAFIMSLFAYDLIRFVINVMSVMTPFSILLLLTLYRPQFMRRSMCTTLFIFCIASLIPYFLFPALQALCGGMVIYPLLIATMLAFAVCRVFCKEKINISG